MSDKSSEEEKKKSITIRGIDQDLYEKMVNFARDSGRTVGEVMNQAMSSFLGVASETANVIDQTLQRAKETGRSFVEGFNEARKGVSVIADLDDLTLSKEEIINHGKQLSFRNIKRLTFPDIDEQTFENYIVSIVSVDELDIPKSLNKLKVLQRGRFVKKIVQSNT
ncbi:hypothetical protein SUSAZ_01195 [Sulfolobus acidocaldarius SUSAZ]|nr:hypothetical protein SUSAZ_01195 [Sulfolobus acidocaldarius SUSAZ]